MDTNLALLSAIQQLEVELHKPMVRGDRKRLDALLHADFVEFGRSGRIYTKADILSELSAQHNPSTVWRTTSRFACSVPASRY